MPAWSVSWDVFTVAWISSDYFESLLLPQWRRRWEEKTTRRNRMKFRLFSLPSSFLFLSLLAHEDNYFFKDMIDHSVGRVPQYLWRNTRLSTILLSIFRFEYLISVPKSYLYFRETDPWTCWVVAIMLRSTYNLCGILWEFQNREITPNKGR